MYNRTSIIACSSAVTVLLEYTVTDACFIKVVQQSSCLSKQIHLLKLFCDSAGTQVQGPTVLTVYKNFVSPGYTAGSKKGSSYASIEILCNR